MEPKTTSWKMLKRRNVNHTDSRHDMNKRRLLVQKFYFMIGHVAQQFFQVVSSKTNCWWKVTILINNLWFLEHTPYFTKTEPKSDHANI